MKPEKIHGADDAAERIAATIDASPVDILDGDDADRDDAATLRAAEHAKALRAALARNGEGDDAEQLLARIRAAGDPTLAFAPDALDLAVALERDDGPGYQRLRLELKACKVALGQWDAAVTRHRRELARLEAEAAAAERAAARAERAAAEAQRAPDDETRDDAPEPGVYERTFRVGEYRVAMRAGETSATIATPCKCRGENDDCKRCGGTGIAGERTVHVMDAMVHALDRVESYAAPTAEPAVTFRVGFKQRGEPFSVEVAADAFDRLEWLTPATHGRVVVSPGREPRDLARVSIAATMKHAPARRRYGFTGYVRAPDRPEGWVYLSAGGAIGAAVRVEGYDVRPPEALARYELPAPPDDDDRRDAALAVLDFAEVGGDLGARVLLPCLGATIRAGLGPVEKGVTVWLSAQQDTGKSYLASILQRFYGATFAPNAPPVSLLKGHSSDVGIARVLAAAGDALVWCDDARDDGVELASRVVQAHFNRAVDAKARRDGGLRASTPPRATVLLIAGELLPRGHSVRSRAVILDMRDRPGDLSRFDALAAEGVFARAMSAIIAWHLGALAGDAGGDLEMMRRRDRSIAKAWDLAGGGRNGESFGPLASGLDTLATWLDEVLPDHAARIEALRARSREALAVVLAEQGAHVAEESPAHRFVELLAGAIAGGRDAHVGERWPNGRHGAPQATPDAWGWRLTGGEWRPAGECVGWILPNLPGAVVLNTSAALNVVSKRARELGHPLPMDSTRLGAALYRAGLLRHVEIRGGGRVDLDRETVPVGAKVDAACRAGGVKIPGVAQPRFPLVRVEALRGSLDLDHDASAEGRDTAA